MKADGWLLSDFARSNPLLYLFLELPKEKKFTRRFFYWIPTRGEPIKIVHAIEAQALDDWPGTKEIYSSWQTLHTILSSVVQGNKKIAMEYSPNNEIPYVSRVDGGTLDLIRSFGTSVVSSADFLPYFTAVLDGPQLKGFFHAGKVLDELAAATWLWMGNQLSLGKTFTEYEAQQFILEGFAKHNMVTHSPPDVSFNANTADPHYCPSKHQSRSIRPGDFVLIDLWCHEADDRAIFADITRVAVAAKAPTEREKEIFQIVRGAQRAATDFIIEQWKKKQRVEGYQVDDVARNWIKKAGYGERFIHRTGHNIGVELHGSGAHIDNFEMHDVRPLLPGTCFSIEPGIYLEGEFGIRLEYDLYLDTNGNVHIVGGIQDEIVCLDTGK